MTISYTQHFRFGIPDFTSSPWHETFEALVQDIDRALFGALLGVGFTVWDNSTTYAVGDTVIDPDDGSLWFALVPNTSAVTPTTFAQDRLNNPSYWGSLIGSVSGVTGPGTSTDNAVARWNGTSGAALQSSKATVSDDGMLEIIPTPLTITKGLNISQVGPNAQLLTGDNNYNYIQVLNDQTQSIAPNIYSSGMRVYLQSGGAATGTKLGFFSLVQWAFPGSAGINDLIGGTFWARSDANAGGTDTGANSRGTLYGGNPVAQAAPGATNYFVVSGGEVDTIIMAGASAKHRWGWSIPSLGDNQGTSSDGALQISAVAGSVRWRMGILFSNANGTFPVDTAGTCIGTDGNGSVANGIDFSSYTFSGYFLRSPGFTVNGVGDVRARQGTFGATGVLNNGVTVTDDTAAGVFIPSGLGGNSIFIGSVSAHPLYFGTNFVVSGYIDTAQRFNLGSPGIMNGLTDYNGFTSGKVTVRVQSNAGTYNFNLPTTPGAAGQVLTSAAGGAAPMTWSSIIDESATALTDGASVPVDASVGNVFSLIAAGDRTIAVPTNAPGAGRTQRMIIRHQASGANRTLTLTTGSAGAFRFGTTITGLTVTTSGKTDYIGCLWNAIDSRWDVVAYSKGF